MKTFVLFLLLFVTACYSTITEKHSETCSVIDTNYIPAHTNYEYHYGYYLGEYKWHWGDVNYETEYNVSFKFKREIKTWNDSILFFTPNLKTVHVDYDIIYKVKGSTKTFYTYKIRKVFPN